MVEKCAYKFRSKARCLEEPYKSFPCCILHIDFPDKADPNYQEIDMEKNYKVRKRVNGGNFNFEGAKLSLVDFDNLVDDDRKKIDIQNLNFNDARIYGDASFNDDTIYVMLGFTVL